MNYREGTDYDYYAAGKRSSNQSLEQADNNFDSLATEHGVNRGPYGSWDQFWMGYQND